MLPLGLGAAGVLLLALSLVIPVAGKIPLTSIPAWSLFGLVAAVTTLVGILMDRPTRAGNAALLTQGGAAGVGMFWVLIGVPSVPSTNSLLITLAAAATASAAWFGLRGRG
jgi:hypothetical protein